MWRKIQSHQKKHLHKVQCKARYTFQSIQNTGKQRSSVKHDIFFTVPTDRVHDVAAGKHRKWILRNPLLSDKKHVHCASHSRLIPAQFYRQPIDIHPCKQQIPDWEGHQLTKHIMMYHFDQFWTRHIAVLDMLDIFCSCNMRQAEGSNSSQYNKIDTFLEPCKKARLPLQNLNKKKSTREI